MERIIRATYHGEENDREGHVLSRADGEKKPEAAEQHGDGGMPAAFPGSVGMPSVQLLSQKARQVRQGSKKCHSQVALSGQALQYGGKPKCDPVISSDRKEIAEREENNVTMTQGLPNAVGANVLLRFFLPIEFGSDPLALLGGEPVCLAWPVCEVNESNQTQQDRWDSFEDEELPPASQTEP